MRKLSNQSPTSQSPTSSSNPRFFLVAIIMMGMMASCGDEHAKNTSSSAQDPRPHVLLLTLDTLRQDRLGAYGYEHAQTPCLDALCEKGVKMTEAYTAAPITLPAHASILLGSYPFVHGLRDNAIACLSQSHQLLSESLDLAGYQTSAFVSATVLGKQFGLDQGFQVYDDHVSQEFGAPGRMPDQSADKTTDKVLAHWKTLEDGPFFTWVHYFDPHQPWQAPEPFASQCEDPYDAEIAFLDSQIQRLIEHLDQNGQRDNTLIVVCADHGEGLGEHGEDTHGFFLYQGTMKIPLIIQGPNIPEGLTVESLVRTIDITPTILDWLSLDDPTVRQGSSLLPLMREEAKNAELREAYLETYLPNYGFGWSWIEGLVSKGHKFIESPTPELYDLLADPGEQNNLLKRDETKSREWANRLIALREDLPQDLVSAEPYALDVTSEELRSLMDMGYAGSGAPELTPERGPDVKDVYASIKGREVALQYFVEERFDEAIPLLIAFKEATKNRPARAQEVLGSTLSAKANQLINQGKRQEAQPYLERAKLELEECVSAMPIYYDAQLSLALVYRLLGDHEKQEEHLREALKLNPNSKAAHHYMGLLLLSKQRWQEAVVHFEAHLKQGRPQTPSTDEQAPMSAILLGNCYFELKDYDAAKEAYRKAQEVDATFIDGVFYLGRVNDKEGHTDEALSHYQKFLDLASRSQRKVPEILLREARTRVEALEK